MRSRSELQKLVADAKLQLANCDRSSSVRHFLESTVHMLEETLEYATAYEANATLLRLQLLPQEVIPLTGNFGANTQIFHRRDGTPKYVITVHFDPKVMGHDQLQQFIRTGHEMISEKLCMEPTEYMLLVLEKDTRVLFHELQPGMRRRGTHDF